MSFLTALVHHDILVEGVVSVQVASLDRAGRVELGGLPVEYHLLPRDLWFGYAIGVFEGERVAVATPEKALLDWCWLAEETGLDPRLDEMEWDSLDLEELDRLAIETGVMHRAMLPGGPASSHDQAQLRAEAIARLR